MDGMDPVLPPRPDLRVPPSLDDWTTPIPRRRGHRAIALVVSLAMVASALFGGVAYLLRGAFQEPGEPWEYRYLAIREDGSPLRWNPCAPIHYVVNPGRSPDGSIDDVHESVDRVADATGITFVYDGITDEVVRSHRPAYQPDRYPGRWAPVLIGWVDPGATDISFRDGKHVAAAVARPVTPPSGEEVIVSGWIAMSEDDPNPPGFGAPGAQGPTLLHEWGHILGLGHVGVDGQLMEPSGGWMRDFGPGDLSGLEELGVAGGCLTVPEPRG
jgi:hypothetical protein